MGLVMTTKLDKHGKLMTWKGKMIDLVFKLNDDLEAAPSNGAILNILIEQPLELVMNQIRMELAGDKKRCKHNVKSYGDMVIFSNGFKCAIEYLKNSIVVVDKTKNTSISDGVKINELCSLGHPYHCSCRQVWGDG